MKIGLIASMLRAGVHGHADSCSDRNCYACRWADSIDGHLENDERSRTAHEQTRAELETKTEAWEEAMRMLASAVNERDHLAGELEQTETLLEEQGALLKQTMTRLAAAEAELARAQPLLQSSRAYLEAFRIAAHDPESMNVEYPATVLMQARRYAREVDVDARRRATKETP